MSDTPNESAVVPLTIEQMLGLAALRQSEGKFSDVETLAGKILAHFPDHPHALYFRGVAAAALGNWDVAKSSLAIVCGIEGAADMARDSYAGVLVATSDWPTLGALAETVLADIPDSARAYFWRALARHGLGDVPAALSDARRSVALDPHVVEPRFLLGNLLLIQGDAGAVAHLERVVAQAPDRADARNNLGLALQGQHRLDEAKQAFEQAIGISPDYQEARANLAVVLLMQGQPELAERYFEQVIEAAPHLSSAIDELKRAVAAENKA
jgi:tetratricopeptide (TPR) repeat protein